jgi:hypothetical protein
MTPASFIQGVGPAMKAEGRNRVDTLEQAIEKQRGKRDDGTPSSAPKQTAPQAAIDYLKAHPEAKEAFKAKYGYLPDGN